MAEHSGFRIGDKERDEAIAQLREHHGDGRLDVEEFDERMSSALQARTLDDLAALFDDLPPIKDQRYFGRRNPSTELAARTATTPAVVTGQNWNWRQGLSGAAFPLALIVCFATGWQYWWIMLIPMMVTAALLGDDDEDKHDETPKKQDQKSLPGGSA